MERPTAENAPELTAPEHQKLTELREKVLERIAASREGEPDPQPLFTYPGRDDQPYTMTLDEAFLVSGKHMIGSPESIDALAEHVMMFYEFTKSIEVNGRLEASRERGKKFLIDKGFVS